MIGLTERFGERRIDLTWRQEIALRGAATVAASAQRRVTVYRRAITADASSSSIRPAGHEDLRHVEFGELLEAVQTEKGISPEHVARWRDRLLDEAGGTGTANVSVQWNWRWYENSERCVQATSSAWAQVVVRHHGTAGPGRQITDGTGDLDAVGDVLASCAAELPGTGQGSAPPCLRTGDREDLWLTPTVAGVLLHELLGHGSEEGLACHDARPSEAAWHLAVSARHPRPSGVDDEGAAIASVPLLQDGRPAGSLLDREARGIHSGSLSSLAQASPHAGPPRVRCTHMVAEAPGQLHPSADPPRSAVVCQTTMGGEYHGGLAIVGVSSATRPHGESGEAHHEPFTFCMTLPEFLKKLVATGPVAEDGRAASCLKFGQSLPTLTRSVSLLLRDVRLLPIGTV